MMRRLALAALLALVGCAVAPSAPEAVKTEVVTVRVPVPTPCVDALDVPHFPAQTRVDPEAASDLQISAAVAADLTALEVYASKVAPLLEQCKSKGEGK